MLYKNGFENLIKQYSCLLVIFFSISFSTKLLAATTLVATVTIDQKSFKQELTFSRDNLFTNSFAYNFNNILSPVTIEVEGLPASDFIINANRENNMITVRLNYPDPFFTPINFNTVHISQIRLFFDNESTEFIEPLLLGLAKRRRIELLGQLYTALKPADFINYQNNLYIGIITIAVEHPQHAYSLWHIIKQIDIADKDKLSIVNMVLGYSDVAAIQTMENTIANNSQLMSFVSLLQQEFTDNDILNYLKTS
jgi:hypothetical protein